MSTTKEKIKKAWNRPSGMKGTKQLQVQNLQVKDITFVDLKVEGVNLAARDRNGFSDPYFVIKVPNEETKKSHAAQLALEAAELGELIYHVVEYSITPYLIPFKIAHYAFEFACKTHPPTKGFKEIYKSDVIKKELNPKWPVRRLGFYDLCWGDVDLPFLIEVYDWDRLKYSDLIGSCFISVRDLLKAETTEIEIRDGDDKKSGSLKLSCIPSNALSEIPPKESEDEKSLIKTAPVGGNTSTNTTEHTIQHTQSTPHHNDPQPAAGLGQPQHAHSVQNSNNYPQNGYSVQPETQHANSVNQPHLNPVYGYNTLQHAHSVGQPHQGHQVYPNPSTVPGQLQHAHSVGQNYAHNNSYSGLAPPTASPQQPYQNPSQYPTPLPLQHNPYSSPLPQHNQYSNLLPLQHNPYSAPLPSQHNPYAQNGAVNSGYPQPSVYNGYAQSGAVHPEYAQPGIVHNGYAQPAVNGYGQSNGYHQAGGFVQNPGLTPQPGPYLQNTWPY